ARAETHSVGCGDGDKLSVVEAVEDRMDALEKVTVSGGAILFIERNSSLIQLAKNSPRRKTALLRARDDAGGGLGRQLPCGPDKVFEFAEHCGADFICGRAVKREFQNAVAPIHARRLALQTIHATIIRLIICCSP